MNEEARRQPTSGNATGPGACLTVTWKLNSMVAILPQAQDEPALRFQPESGPRKTNHVGQSRIARSHITRVNERIFQNRYIVFKLLRRFCD